MNINLKNKSVQYIMGYFDALGIDITELNEDVCLKGVEVDKPYFVNLVDALTIGELYSKYSQYYIDKAKEAYAEVLIWDYENKGYIIFLQTIKQQS